MKQLLLILSFCCMALIANAQSAYIQVNGEPGLSVYLNNTFKGKTTAQLNGYIIENVTPGKNLIKIEKEGYAPFEEYVTVKADEVFAYKVKPFTKHVVSISEQGRTGETEKKVELKTGKLIVQSVPIEIKISIPQIEGVNNMAKTKDQWMVNDLTEGAYTATFKFGDKTITKTIQIDADNTTSVFINMLSGDFKTKSTLDEKRAIQQTIDAQTAFVKEFCSRYKFASWRSVDEFLKAHPEAKLVYDHSDNKDKSEYIGLSDKQLKKQQQYLPGYTKAHSLSKSKMVEAEYTLVFTKDYSTAKAACDKIVDEFKSKTWSKQLSLWKRDGNVIDGATIYAYDNKMDLSVALTYWDGWYHTHLIFSHMY